MNVQKEQYKVEAGTNYPKRIILIKENKKNKNKTKTYHTAKYSSTWEE